MKITAIIGSPLSKGNSATMVNLLLEGLKPVGMQAKVFELNNMSYRGCQACMGCKTGSETCIVRDDLTEVLEEVRTSDVVIVASPVYMGELTAQTKGLIDRFYSFLKPDFRTNPNPGRLAPGKKLVFVVPQGNPDAHMFADIISRYSAIFQRFGFSTIYPLRALGVGPQSDVRQNSAIMDIVSHTAAELLA